MALAIVRSEHSADDLRAAARRTKDSRQARRLLAIALVLDGASRGAAARAGGMDRQTLRDWVIRYNEEGIKGLRDRPRSGRRPRLSPEQRGELAQLVELAERQIERILKQLKFARISVRPRHPKADEATQQAFKKTSAPW